MAKKDSGLTSKKQRGRIAKTLRKAARKVEKGDVSRGVELMRQAYGDVFFPDGSRYGN